MQEEVGGDTDRNVDAHDTVLVDRAHDLTDTVQSPVDELLDLGQDRLRFWLERVIRVPSEILASDQHATTVAIRTRVVLPRAKGKHQPP